MAAHVMTARRRAALRKAQAASARKRRGKGKGKLAAANRRATRNKRIALATGGLAGAAALAGYSQYKSAKYYKASSKQYQTRLHAANINLRIEKISHARTKAMRERDHSRYKRTLNNLVNYGYVM